MKDSGRLLERLGYSYVAYTTPRVEPERVETRFSDIVSVFSRHPIGSMRMYRHQLEAFRALLEGRNIILRSGTGSGKTEAWVAYVLSRAERGQRLRVLAVYPTLALANDQIRRLSTYASLLGLSVIQLDAVRRQELEKEHGRRGLRDLVATADIVVTNPAFLLHEVKRLIENPRKPLLEPFLRRLGLLVVDELDFYGPRSIALLLAMLRLLASYTQEKLQVAILTATLANPEEVATYISSVTGRETSIIDGRAFHPENHVYIVLGKELKRIWERLREIAMQARNSIDKEIAEALEDWHRFQENAYTVISYFEALGFDVPSPGLDPVEILANYVDDEYATLVFTRSIAAAEQLARALRERLGRDDIVATHHHLVPKKRREEIEAALRDGRLKLVVSPRTLVQGIDIGTIGRIVHIGLPEDVRDFLQREGRKGRRPDMGFTETVIIPASRWDRELLSKGVDALLKWLQLGPEKVVVNPQNKYIALFTGLAKILSPWLKESLDPVEEEVLRDTRVLGPKGVNIELARSIWERIGFYEYGPPYGIKRYLETRGELKPLEPIGFCDLVERFQPGCIDHGEDAIVVDLRRASRSRIVTAVIEKPLREFNPWQNEALAEAVEEYEYIKRSWGEKPGLLRDIARAKLVTHVLAVVYPPRKGFGLLRKIPNRVIWTLYSEKPRILRTSMGPVIVYDRRQIYVPVNTAGEYRDYTYGYVIEASDRDNPTVLRLGLALIALVLRRRLGYSLDTIHYGVEKIGEHKLLEIHEPEAAGIIEKLDWASLRKILDTYEPDELDLVLLQQLDEIAYSDLVSLGLDWDIAKKGAQRVLDLLTALDKIVAYLGGKRIEIPRPSRAHKLVALDVISEQTSSNEVVPEVLVGIAWFDGENVNTVVEAYAKLPFTKPPSQLLAAETSIEDLVLYEDFKLVVEDRDAAKRALREAGLRRLERLVGDALELRDILVKTGLDPDTPLDIVADAIGVTGQPPRLEEVLAKLAGRERPGKWALETLKSYQANRVRRLYLAYLALTQLAHQNSHASSQSV